VLVEDQKLEAVISLPSGAFKPYSGVSTGILIFTKTNSGGTDYVWFYDVQADGRSLDDKRQELLTDDKFGPVPKLALSPEEHAKNNLQDVLARWKKRETAERERPRTAQSFCISKADVVGGNYDLSTAPRKKVYNIKLPVTLGAHQPLSSPRNLCSS
jgi:type I restriction enzyme M protein